MNELSVIEEEDGWLTEHVVVIRTRSRAVIGDVIEIGRRLALCKERIAETKGHGHWLPFLQSEFRWSENTARNFMRINELAKSANFADFELPMSAVYLLAAPSTTEKAREAVIAEAKARREQAGEQMTTREVKRRLREDRSSTDQPPRRRGPYGPRKSKTDQPRRGVGRPRKTETEQEPARKRPEHSDLMRQRGELWGQLRTILTQIASLPDPTDVANAIRKTARVGHIVDAKLGKAINWLAAFNKQWRKGDE
jgi:hypothetical protein